MSHNLPLQRGIAIPAHPLALTTEHKLDERRQRALSRYYLAAGAGGLAVGVHTTQFQIHDPACGLLQPVLALAAEEMDRADKNRDQPLVRVAGICGQTAQAVREAQQAHDLGFQLGLINLGAMRGTSPTDLVQHCRAIAEAIDLFGFYLHPAGGGIELPIEFWRGFCEIENVRAIKVATFDRYLTLHVMRAVVESGRQDIALYTGNDDNILLDLVTPFTFQVGDHYATCRFAGGLLGQWAVGTKQGVKLLAECHQQLADGGNISQQLLTIANQLTDINAALFDVANNFRGCIPGIHEVLRRQGLLAGVPCLDETETLGSGQMAELDRVLIAYPHLWDDQFVAEHRDDWLS
jgi:hypothetical protein